MILADKIIENRKKNGWSQEELADRLGVSRQSVSKWEGAQAVPDMKKILQMADLFNVSTDYLLRDEIGEPEAPEAPEALIDSGLGDTVRIVTMEDANDFLNYNEKAASGYSTGVMLCILSPVMLILLGGLAEAGFIPVQVEIAGASGLVILLLMVAAAVAMFISNAMKGKPYEYLENTYIDTAYGVTGMAREKQLAYSEKHSRLLIVGIMLCIVSAVPLFLTQLFHYSNNTDLLPVLGMAGLLVICASGVKLIVLTCIRNGGFEKLLETGDYTRVNKRAGKYDGIYWAIALAVYLGWSFVNMRWDITWIVWPVAGVLFAAYKEIMRAIVRR